MKVTNRLVMATLVLGVALVASACAPARVYVVEEGRTTEYTGGLITSEVGPIDLVACFVPDNGSEVVAAIWAEMARGLFTEVRENYKGLDPVCDLKLVINATVLNLDVFAARSGRRLFGLEREIFADQPHPRLRAALYHKFADDPKLVARVQTERPLQIVSRPDQTAQRSQIQIPAQVVPISDVDQPPAGRPAKQNRYAIVVGVEQYRTKLPKADFAAQDAKIMGAYLTKTMGFSEENVAILVNENATRTDLEKYIEHWLPNRVEKDGTVFIYYSGHGAPNPKTGDAYLVPYDGDPAFVEATGYPLKRLYAQLGKLPAKEVVVLLDSCFSGAGGRSVIAKGMRPMVLSMENPVLAGGKTVVLAASKGDQVSSTYDQKGHGLLTYFFLKGLQGEADVNKDGSVDLAEVYDYVKPQVERTARREYNNDQTPQLLNSPGLPAKGVRLVERPGSAKP